MIFLKLQQVITGIQHIGIPTKDLEKTIAFYTGLDFEVASRAKNDKTGEHVAFLRLKNIMIETYESKDVNAQNGAIDHISLDISDIEAAFDEIRKGGYRLLDSEIQSLPFWDHGIRYFTIEGPNHEKIEFCQIL